MGKRESKVDRIIREEIDEPRRKKEQDKREAESED